MATTDPDAAEQTKLGTEVRQSLSLIGMTILTRAAGPERPVTSSEPPCARWDSCQSCSVS